MWSWVTKATGKTWNGCQTVPRVIELAPPPQGSQRARELSINPAAEVDLLRSGQAVVSVPLSPLSPDHPSAVHDARGVQLDVLVNLSWQAGADAVNAGVRVLVPEGGGAGFAITFSLQRATESFLPSTNIPHGDLPGEDFSLNASHPWTPQAGASACAARCDSLTSCTCWTYVPAGPRCAIKGPGGAKGGPLFPVPGPDVSGYKAGHVPSNLTIPTAPQVTVSGGAAGVMPGHLGSSGATAELRILVDHSVVEVYDGTAAMALFNPVKDIMSATGVQLFATSQGVSASLEVYSMNSAVV